MTVSAAAGLPLFDPDLGARRRDRGMEQVGLASSLRDPGWTERAWRQLNQLAREGEPFTSDDLVAAAGLPIHQNAMGELFRRASKVHDLIRPTGRMLPSRRPEARGRALREWIGRGRA
ncbi:MAG: hypothetical protein ACYDAY_11575 [Candidatus Dormibacteria bacterium]